MASILPSETQAVASLHHQGLRYAPALAAATAAVGIVVGFWETVLSIVTIWTRSETFAHGYVVVPLSIWLAWRERRRLQLTPARPWLPALVAVAAAGCLWLVMSLANVDSVRQFALLFMVQAAIVAVVGLDVAKVAAFPLLFLLFAVPTGEFLLPTLMNWTAEFTISALRASGVPVFREANHFVIPSGAWSVVEACSGLRYLIASMMVGVVYAAVSYRTRWRQVAFVAASIVVPIIANWLRAYMIVMLGHLSDNRIAVGVDHLIYGWVFFGVVMLLLYWTGSFWSERDTSVAREAANVAPRVVTNNRMRFFAVAVAAIAVAVAFRPGLALLEANVATAPPRLAALSASNGFEPSDQQFSAWTPTFEGHSATLRQSFAKGDAQSALHVAYYPNQAKGRELITSVNQLARTINRSWSEVRRETVSVDSGGRPVEVVRSVLAGPRERLVAYSLYWIDGTLTISDYEAKAREAWSKLRGRGGDAALIVFYAPEQEGRDVARETLEALLPQAVRMLAAAREGQ